MSTQENEFPEMDLNIKLDFSDIGHLLEQRPTTEFQLQEYHVQLLKLKFCLKQLLADTDHRIDFILGNLFWTEYLTGEPRLEIEDAE